MSQYVPTSAVPNLYPAPPARFVRQYSHNLGGANAKSIFEDDQGRFWLFKPQSTLDTMTDITASRIARLVGVASPLVYDVNFVWNGQPMKGGVQPFLRAIVRTFGLSRDLSECSSTQIEALQCHQVLDWLLANADPHRGQFLILQDDTLVGIDKTQSLRFFPHDSLDWRANAKPFNTKLPVYYYLYRKAGSGRISLSSAVALNFAAHADAVLPDVMLRQLWQPVIALWPVYRLVFATLQLPQNDTQARILDKIENRKHNLIVDFTNLYSVVP